MPRGREAARPRRVVKHWSSGSWTGRFVTLLTSAATGHLMRFPLFCLMKNSNDSSAQFCWKASIRIKASNKWEREKNTNIWSFLRFMCSASLSLILSYILFLPLTQLTRGLKARLHCLRGCHEHKCAWRVIRRGRGRPRRSLPRAMATKKETNKQAAQQKTKKLCYNEHFLGHKGDSKGCEGKEMPTFHHCFPISISPPSRVGRAWGGAWKLTARICLKTEEDKRKKYITRIGKNASFSCIAMRLTISSLL